MGLSKALIEILDAEAVDPSRGLRKTFEVQFNPNQYSISKKARYAETPIKGLTLPLLSFVREEAEGLKFDLFFDTSLAGTDVRDKTKPFFELVKVQPRTHAPPRVRFTWGQGLSFRGVVDDVNQTFTLFTSAGIPTRATLKINLKQYRTLTEQLQELNLQSSDHTKVREVRRGDTLTSIAAQEYGDASVWRVIAEANTRLVDNPRKLEPGIQLTLPRLEAGHADRRRGDVGSSAR